MKRCFTLLLLILAALTFFSCDNNTSPEDELVGKLEITPPGGSYNETVSVFIHCPTYDATIHYTLDGSTPTQESDIYSGQLQVNTDTVLKARAFKPGYIASAVATATYQFSSDAVQAVVISPDGGTFPNPHPVTMTCPTPGAEIYYTTDGSDPTQSSSRYTAPFMVSGSVVVKARAYKEGFLSSIITSTSYNMQLLPPTFSLAEGHYLTPQVVTITHANTAAQIRYTTDGTDPDLQSTLYTQPINILGNTMLKARAYMANWQPSEVATASYIISLAEQFQVIPAGSFHNGTANVQLSAYYIGRREVTELEWVYIMLDMPEIVPDKPKTEISWVNAIEYCNYRSLAEGFTPCYSYADAGTIPALWPADWIANHTQISCDWNANGYRLPTEMEWMYAAQGGQLSQGYRYSGSNNLDQVGWYSANCTEPAPTAIKEPNELGLFDMSGNVWEFVWDIYYFEYPSSDTQNPSGPSTGMLRGMRGGSFSTDESNCTVTRRFYTQPNLLADTHGIRVVRKF